MRRVLALALSFFAVDAGAQQSEALVRADGKSVPAVVYGVDKGACRGIAVISHGAGGSEEGMAYLAKALSNDDWLSVVVRHQESGSAVLREDIRRAGIKGGLLEMVTDRSAYEARAMDIGAALEWAQPRCSGTFRALLGHSMGAAATMLEAGAQNKLGIAAGKDRFDAYVAMSPQGPGSVFPEAAWLPVAKPMLMLTGTRDDALEGTPGSRLIAYEAMPAGCKWLGVIDGATHMNFAGRGRSGKTEALVVAATRVFLDGLASGRCDPLPAGEGIAYKHK